MTAETTEGASTDVSEAVDNWTALLREKILFGLSVYPYLSPSMLHVFLGTATSTHVWKPILNGLIAEGLVVREEVSLTSPHERTQSYTILHLTENAYTPPCVLTGTSDDGVTSEVTNQ